jgi:hypothetical protein
MLARCVSRSVSGMSKMQEIGNALRDRMDAAVGASFTIRKVGPAWNVSYRDERGAANVTSLRAENAVLALATDLGLL